MATGGGDFGYDDPNLDKNIDNDDDDFDVGIEPNSYDDEAVQQALNKTYHFVPGAASTPRGVEQYEMQMMPNEESGLPDRSYAERPLLGDFLNPEERQSRVDRAIDFIKRRFP